MEGTDLLDNAVANVFSLLIAQEECSHINALLLKVILLSGNHSPFLKSPSLYLKLRIIFRNDYLYVDASRDNYLARYNWLVVQQVHCQLLSLSCDYFCETKTHTLKLWELHVLFALPILPFRCL